MLRNAAVRTVKVPRFPELNVKDFWKEVKTRPYLLQYFPEYKESQLPEREYFFNLLFSLDDDFVIDKIREAENLRKSGGGPDEDSLIFIKKDLLKEIIELVVHPSKFWII